MRDLFEKVKRDAESVRAAASPDALFNFVVTAQAIGDWIQNDPDVAEEVKSSCRSMVKTNSWLQVCRDIANGSKHFAISNYVPTAKAVEFQQGYGVGRFGAGAFGVGEVTVMVSWDNQRQEIQAITAQVVAAWENFFTQYFGDER